MTITVYSVSGAPKPWRVLLGLTFKDLEYNIELLKVSENEHKSEPFLKLNPRGTVPVLIDGATIIRDSIGALAWLDRAYPDNPLFGSNISESAIIWQTTCEIADYLRSSTDALLSPIVFEGAIEPTAALTEASKIVQKELLWLDTMLNDQKFLAGDTPSAADAVAFPEIRILQRVADTKPEIMAHLDMNAPLTPYPNLAAWKSRIEDYPGYLKTYPTHWLEAN